MNNSEFFDEISEVMLRMQLKPHDNGFDYLRRGVELFLQEGNGLKNVGGEVSKIYSLLAGEFSTNEGVIEKSIRSLLTSAYASGGLLAINEYFGVVVFNNACRLTNGEAIKIIAEIVKLNQMRGVSN